MVFDKVERQIHKYKTRLMKRKYSNFADTAVPAQAPAAEAADEGEFEIIKNKRFIMHPMTPEEAILQMNLLNHDFFVFYDPDLGATNVVYRRKDGKYVFEWHDTKTHNSKRTIPLTTRAMEALKKQRVRGQEILLKNAQTAQDEYKNLVFVTRNNRPTQQFIVQECMDVTTRRIQKEHPEFERFSPHCFRHTFATRAIENGMQPKSVQKLLGHGSLQLTMDLYCHVTDDTLFDEMRKMEAV